MPSKSRRRSTPRTRTQKRSRSTMRQRSRVKRSSRSRTRVKSRSRNRVKSRSRSRQRAIVGRGNNLRGGVDTALAKKVAGVTAATGAVGAASYYYVGQNRKQKDEAVEQFKSSFPGVLKDLHDTNQLENILLDQSKSFSQKLHSILNTMSTPASKKLIKFKIDNVTSESIVNKMKEDLFESDLNTVVDSVSRYLTTTDTLSTKNSNFFDSLLIQSSEYSQFESMVVGFIHPKKLSPFFLTLDINQKNRIKTELKNVIQKEINKQKKSRNRALTRFLESFQEKSRDELNSLETCLLQRKTNFNTFQKLSSCLQTHELKNYVTEENAESYINIIIKRLVDVDLTEQLDTFTHDLQTNPSKKIKFIADITQTKPINVRDFLVQPFSPMLEHVLNLQTTDLFSSFFETFKQKLKEIGNDYLQELESQTRVFTYYIKPLISSLTVDLKNRLETLLLRKDYKNLLGQLISLKTINNKLALSAALNYLNNFSNEDLGKTKFVSGLSKVFYEIDLNVWATEIEKKIREGVIPEKTINEIIVLFNCENKFIPKDVFFKESFGLNEITNLQTPLLLLESELQCMYLSEMKPRVQNLKMFLPRPSLPQQAQ